MTPDGVPLAATRYVPAGPARGAVFIAPAMAVPQTFYRAFSSWLAGAGFEVMTYDYRGMGRSLRGPMRKVDADILTWAERDTVAALDAFSAEIGELPLTWMAHSLGGQIIPFVANHGRADKIVTIASGTGYWRYNAPPTRRKVGLFWWGLVPLLTPLFGYFPGKRLGVVGDVPKGAIRQWRAWCMNPEYAVGVLGDTARAKFAAVETPIACLSFTDDEMMSERSIASLHGFYTSAPQTARHLAPADLGVKRIGHFGGFRASMRAPLWEPYVLPELARLD
ncbi:MAG: alpha/beta fold hydrolase [Deltaproteobacteria bacterium]|nr:MAG: alpha/beta fold hydrolase [Deltaproteobacteria bacterium]